ncbi:phasin family protein [Sphingomonas sp.]|uniref:phasin family protein n=1 Tax=Sphingomonas sp. TaxID=28214 RepID=UPI003CC52A9A
MTDQPVNLPTPESLETEVSIPAVLAASKPSKAKKVKADGDRFAGAPATFPGDAPAPLNPTAAAPAETSSEEPIMATTFENVVDNTTEKTQAHVADMTTRAKDAMEKGAKFFAELNSFNKGNVEALVESGKIVVAGAQTMAQDQAAYVRKQFEEATAAARTMTAVKSPAEFVKLQGDYVRQQFDAMVAETSRSTEAMLKLAGQVVQPISNRVAVAVERIKLAA